MNGNATYNKKNKRRYNSYAEWFTEHFGQRVQKVSLDAGFSCPNRDGSLGVGGCAYCDNKAFNPSYCTPEKSVTQQLNEGIAFHRRRYRRAESYLAYFQAYSNTYAGIEQLKKLYEEALHHPGIVGLVIGTRPDCVNDTILDFLAEMSRKCFVMVEYGIETVNDKTLASINRGHDFEASVGAVKDTASRGILTGGHLIFGLPGDSRSSLVKSAEALSRLPLNTLKIHQLQLIRGTPLTERYKADPLSFDLYTLDEYIDLVVSFTEHLSPSIMIDRISGEAPPRMLADPRDWGLRSFEILRLFEKRLEEKDSWQGKYYNINKE